MQKVNTNGIDEIGCAITRIANKLNSDQALYRLLLDTSDDPLNLEKEDYDTSISLMNKNIFTNPGLDATKEMESQIEIEIPDFSLSPNEDFNIIDVKIRILTPYKKWNVSDMSPRPFKIMSRIYALLNNSKVTGIGTLQCQGMSSTTPIPGYALHTMTFYAIVNG